MVFHDVSHLKCEAQIEFLTGLEGGACPVEVGPPDGWIFAGPL